MMKKIILALAFSGVLLAGCGSGNAAKDSDSTKEEMTKITAVGSTALQPLVDAAQESYTQDHPNLCSRRR